MDKKTWDNAVPQAIISTSAKISSKKVGRNDGFSMRALPFRNWFSSVVLLDRKSGKKFPKKKRKSLFYPCKAPLSRKGKTEGVGRKFTAAPSQKIIVLESGMWYHKFVSV